MTEELNQYSEVKQELEKIIDNCQNYFTVLDSLSEVQNQFKTSAQQVTEQQAKAEEKLQTKLADIQAQLNQFKQEQNQLASQVLQLENQLNNYSEERRLILSQLDRIYVKNLNDYIDRKQNITEEQAIKLMLRTCTILKKNHNLSPPIIHGNIQPSNILVREEDQQVFLIGLKETDKTINNQVPFNSYSAPEQKHGKLIPQSDLYAIGSILIFLLTRKNPQDFYVQNGESYVFNLEEVNEISSKLRQVILQLTEYNPAKRYQTAEQFLPALSACLQS
ncbi:MAG: hypothetical protein AAF349_03185 [Cyanobacteria bacterium P01_A01_bin.68]